MRNQESVPPTNPTQDPFNEALRNWNCYGKGDERLMTLRSIITLTKLSIKPDMEDDDVDQVRWLLFVGEVLADMALYDDQR